MPPRNYVESLLGVAVCKLEKDTKREVKGQTHFTKKLGLNEYKKGSTGMTYERDQRGYSLQCPGYIVKVVVIVEEILVRAMASVDYLLII